MIKVLELISVAVMKICVTALFLSIFIDFYLYHHKQNTKQQKHSLVATGSMMAFYFIYYLVLKYKVGAVSQIPDSILIFLLTVGMLAIISGTIINILGRMQLKGNWANHIKIYEDHQLITKGVYAFVRHPLYASIILMLYGGSILYANWFSAIFVTIVFIPFMVYRAKQEEKLLANEFQEYAAYQKQVGLFFPKNIRGYQNG